MYRVKCMTHGLRNCLVAALVTRGFEESEFSGPKAALEKEGARIAIVAPEDGEIRAWRKDCWGSAFRVDKHLNSALCVDFDALLLPGNALLPNSLAVNHKAIKFIGDFIKMRKPIAAICRAPVLLATTGLLKGRALTSHASVRARLREAGAYWMNQEVVVDRGLLTCSRPENTTLLAAKMIQMFCEETRGYQQAWWGT